MLTVWSVRKTNVAENFMSTQYFYMFYPNKFTCIQQHEYSSQLDQNGIANTQMKSWDCSFCHHQPDTEN